MGQKQARLFASLPGQLYMCGYYVNCHAYSVNSLLNVFVCKFRISRVIRTRCTKRQICRRVVIEVTGAHLLTSSCTSLYNIDLVL